MKHNRPYEPAPITPEALPPCLACGSVRVKALDNWLGHPCLRMIQCQDCGHQVSATGESIELCKAAALEKWTHPEEADDLPWDERTATGLLEEDP